MSATTLRHSLFSHGARRSTRRRIDALPESGINRELVDARASPAAAYQSAATPRSSALDSEWGNRALSGRPRSP